MAISSGAFPYDIDNLLGGATRVLYAPTTEDVPATIADVIDMESPYDPNGDWVDVGATKESFTYTRGFDVEGWEIQQVAGNVIEEVTSITRTIQVSIAEFRPEILQILEEAPSIDAIAAAAHKGAQQKVPFGSFESLEKYRFAFISRRAKDSGVVTESVGAKKRGRFFMGVLNLASISASDFALENAKGALTASGVTFTSYPDSTQDEGEEYGAWYDETAGTISAS